MPGWANGATLCQLCWLIVKCACYLGVGKTILAKANVKEIAQVVVAFLATFYLLDFDYPRNYEIGLSIMQYYVFEDKHVPNDIAVTFNNVIETYQSYKGIDSD